MTPFLIMLAFIFPTIMESGDGEEANVVPSVVDDEEQPEIVPVDQIMPQDDAVIPSVDVVETPTDDVADPVVVTAPSGEEEGDTSADLDQAEVMVDGDDDDDDDDETTEPAVDEVTDDEAADDEAAEPAVDDTTEPVDPVVTATNNTTNGGNFVSGTTEGEVLTGS